jgi:CheY-like chemotaxis protein
MDGFEVADRLRGLPSLRGTELVAITGYGQEVDRQRTREGGFHEHMVKPVDLDELEAWLRRSQEARDRGRPEPPLAGE